MFLATIEHPGIDDRTYTVATPGELRDIVWGVARVQGEPVTDDLAMIAEVGTLWSRATFGEESELKIHGITVTVTDADPSSFECEGHDGEDAVLLGGPAHCDGRCKPRARFDKNALMDLSCALDDAELDAADGCGPCGLEVDWMCAGCGKCNCRRHDECVRPADEAPRAH